MPKPRAIYLGFLHNDCFPYYRCSLCGCNFRGSAVHVDQKRRRCCPKCKQALSGLD